MEDDYDKPWLSIPDEVFQSWFRVVVLDTGIETLEDILDDIVGPGNYHLVFFGSGYRLAYNVYTKFQLTPEHKALLDKGQRIYSNQTARHINSTSDLGMASHQKPKVTFKKTFEDDVYGHEKSTKSCNEKCGGVLSRVFARCLPAWMVGQRTPVM